MRFKHPEKVFKYQLEGAKFALSNYYTLNRDEPGLGKTIQALYAICESQNKNPNGRALVICPQYLRRNWEEEIKDWTTLNWCTFDHKDPDTMWDKDIVLASYYQVRRYWNKLTDDRFDFIVIDEGHNFKNPKSQQTQGLLNLVNHWMPEYLMILTGTPIANKLYDLFIPLYLLSLGKHTKNKITDKYRSYFLFCYRFCEVVRTKYGTQFKGKKNVEELRTYLVGRFIGRKKADVLELPKTLQKPVYIDYKENVELLEAFENFNAGVKGVEPTIKKDSAVLTAPFTIEYCVDLAEKEVGPIIVVSDHREPVELIYKGLLDKGFVAAKVMGGMRPKDRDDTVAAFKAGEMDFLIATIGSIKEGLNLTISSHIVLNDLPWVPSVLKQVMDRIDRIGQTVPGTYHFITGAVVGRKIRNALNEKIRLIKAMFEEK